MKEYELLISAAYKHGGQEYRNCFKEYVRANSVKEAKAAIKKELAADGYIKINVYEVHEIAA